MRFGTKAFKILKLLEARRLLARLPKTGRAHKDGTISKKVMNAQRVSLILCQFAALSAHTARHCCGVLTGLNILLQAPEACKATPAKRCHCNCAETSRAFFIQEFFLGSLQLFAGFYFVYVVGPGGKVNPGNLMSADDQPLAVIVGGEGWRRQSLSCPQ